MIDTAIVVRAQEGDQGAFTTLATAVHGPLHRIAQNVLGDLQLAEDATQQALVELWRGLPRLREPERFEAWSYRILVNACYREIRRSRRWIAGLDVADERDMAAERALSGVAHRDQLEQGFRRVPIDQRAVVVLHYYVDLPLREVAEVLGIPVGTAHSRLNRAMAALRAALEADARLPDGEGLSETMR